jgi:DNA-binding response OmpR family regulator
MAALSLTGQIILVVEDEPLIALDIAHCLQAEGASVKTAHSLAEGLRLAQHPDLSAAILDFGLHDGESTELCERLKGRGLPFVLHSGYECVADVCRSGILLPKPATREQLLATVRRILLSTPGPRAARRRVGRASLRLEPRRDPGGAKLPDKQKGELAQSGKVGSPHRRDEAGAAATRTRPGGGLRRAPD